MKIQPPYQQVITLIKIYIIVCLLDTYTFSIGTFGSIVSFFTRQNVKELTNPIQVYIVVRSLLLLLLIWRLLRDFL